MTCGKNDPCWCGSPQLCCRATRSKRERGETGLSPADRQNSTSIHSDRSGVTLSHTASAVSTGDRDFSLLFIKGSCKRSLCSIINRLPDTTETLDLEYMLSCYAPILNSLPLKLSIHLKLLISDTL